MHRLVAPAIAALAIAIAAPAFAATGGPVSVSIGPALQKKADVYGARELRDLTRSLDETVNAALAHAKAPPARVSLVIDDATPNRPTFEQLGRFPGLSINSIALGGARVSGYVEGADGSRTPVSFSWYETTLENERGAVTWTDADRAFSQLADQIAHGDIPHQTLARAITPHDDFGNWR